MHFDETLFRCVDEIALDGLIGRNLDHVASITCYIGCSAERLWKHLASNGIQLDDDLRKFIWIGLTRLTDKLSFFRIIQPVFVKLETFVLLINRARNRTMPFLMAFNAPVK